ncbi:MAG: sugar phosphate isomerase/epimerase [Chitinophagaceae bacterium]
MNYNRRSFLKVSGGFAAAMALAPMACNSAQKTMGKSTAGNFGLQLYTLRDDLPKDPRGVLKQVASFGYKQIEGYEGPQGMFWGMGHTGFKQYMDELGMNFISSHCDINKDFEKKAAEASAIGMKYLICPYKGPQKSLDDYKKFADEFNKKGEICRQNGIRFAYHNHDYTFKLVDGQFPQDVLMQNTDPATVDYEMDIYWVVAAGQDPATWFNKYKNRFRLCHVKDRTKGATDAADSTTLGEGSIDYAKILTVAKDTGMEYYIVEQEKYTGTTPLKATADDAAYMKKLEF